MLRWSFHLRAEQTKDKYPSFFLLSPKHEQRRSRYVEVVHSRCDWHRSLTIYIMVCVACLFLFLSISSAPIMLIFKYDFCFSNNFSHLYDNYTYSRPGGMLGLQFSFFLFYFLFRMIYFHLFFRNLAGSRRMGARRTREVFRFHITRLAVNLT